MTPANDAPPVDDAARFGIVPESLDAFVSFATSVADGTVTAENRLVHAHQPLVVTLGAALEAVTQATVGQRIVGFNPESSAAITTARKDLEARDRRPELQLVLFAFERICDLAYEALYGPGNVDESRGFFEDAVPEWLEAVRGWAMKEDGPRLVERATAAYDAYMQIAKRIVKPDAK